MSRNIALSSLLLALTVGLSNAQCGGGGCGMMSGMMGGMGGMMGGMGGMGGGKSFNWCK